MSSFNALYGRTSGVATIQEPYLIFTSDVDGAQIKFLLKNIQVSLEGVNSHHYDVFDKFHPQERICIQDEKILTVLGDAGVSGLGVTVRKLKSRRWRRNLLVASPFVTALALLIATPLLISFLPASLMSFFLSPKQEKAIGEWLFPMIRAQHHIEDVHPAQAKLGVLLDQLKAANPELQKFDIKIYVSKDSVPNAFAIPGNKIVINRGIIDRAESIEEVMGVLAHEVGHVEQQHVLKSLSGTVGKLVGGVMLAGLIGYDQTLALMKAADFLHLKHSRDDETAADKRGFEFLRKAHISTAGMIRFFDRLAKESLAIPSAMAFISTHPASEDRVKFLSEMASEFPDVSTVKLAVELKELQALF